MNRLFYIVICLSLSSIASAELYKWVDEDGKVYYTDKDPALDNKKATHTELIEEDAANVFSSDEAKIKPTEKPAPVVEPVPANNETVVPP